MGKCILATGGTGYIGSHTVVELLLNNYDVIIVDNLVNSKEDVINNIFNITKKKPNFIKVDMLDKEKLENVFKKYKIDAVIHFAGFKSVNESVENPIKYYKNNIISTLNLIELMRKYNVNKLVFSSSATVYDHQYTAPYKETSKIGNATNPYAWTKIIIEQILSDLCQSDDRFSVVNLRYFNPVGAHSTGLIGENPNSTPNNLMPYISKVASGELEKLYIYGNDYDTNDGFGVRDFIHVMDIAKGHLLALEYSEKNFGFECFNLGNGVGISVFELIKEFENSNKIQIPYEIVGRRKGDVAISFADVTKANKILNWKTQKTLSEMCVDSWNWEKKRNGK